MPQPGATELTHLGALELTSGFVASEFADQTLFFRHDFAEKDLALRPEWEKIFTNEDNKLWQSEGAPVWQNYLPAYPAAAQLDATSVTFAAAPAAGAEGTELAADGSGASKGNDGNNGDNKKDGGSAAPAIVGGIFGVAVVALCVAAAVRMRNTDSSRASTAHSGLRTARPPSGDANNTAYVAFEEVSES